MKRGSMRYNDFLNSLTEQAAGNVYKKNSVLGKKRINEGLADEDPEHFVPRAPEPSAEQRSKEFLDATAKLVRGH